MFNSSTDGTTCYCLHSLVTVRVLTATTRHDEYDTMNMILLDKLLLSQKYLILVLCFVLILYIL